MAKKILCGDSWRLTVACLFFPGVALAAQPIQTGIVKGTITIGGTPTADVVVSVEGVPPEDFKTVALRLPRKGAVMDQEGLHFVPHVLAVLVGTSVSFPNHDKSWHNIYSASGVKSFDLGLYPPGQSRSIAFDTPGVVRVLCNVHPDMEGYIVVENHPYFSGTDRRGNYEVNGVPLGSYQLQIWHPELGRKIVSFNLVRAGEVLDLNFDLKEK